MRRSKYRLLLQNIPPYTNFIADIIPIVTTTQQISATSLTLVKGVYVFDPSDFDMDHIDKFVCYCEWESAGSGEIILYDATNNTTIAVLASPTAATGYSVSSEDITSYLKKLGSAAELAVFAQGSTAGAITVYKVIIKAIPKL